MIKICNYSKIIKLRLFMILESYKVTSLTQIIFKIISQHVDKYKYFDVIILNALK
jgi:hypothetical protein